ncbi:MAG: SDR family oxidoreductase [Nitrospinae bacterium]|nr:SDR family oxidoreductase [Nitrospinota bacterium]
MIFPEKFSLHDKVAVVTGGAGLIGSEICRALSEAGATVVIAENDKARGTALKDKITGAGFKAELAEIDITSDESVSNAVAEIVKKFGKIDVWINNAYPRTKDWGKKFEDIDMDYMRKNVDMHMNGYFLCCQKALEEMKKRQSGVLINIGSHYGVLGPNFSVYEGTAMTMTAPYSLIKGGIVNFSRYLATYYAKHNIRVNAVCPGGVFDNQNPVFVEKYNKLVPLNKMASPDQIAAPILFLCTDAASYITGQVLMVDGGLSAW